MAEWDDMVLVGTIARTHGLRGHVIVNPETDFVEERFRAGAAVWVRTGTDTAQLAIETMRVQNGRPVIVFEGYGTVEASESLVGRELRIPEQSLQPLEDGVFYHHQLAGCRMVTTAGRSVGLITRVDGSAAGSLLVVDGLNGEVLVPLAADICVTIDVQARVVVVDPPEGLLELNETRSSKGRLGSERSERPERSERSEQ
ncbi:MAG TPA: ribosome maturation factor RimM [Vicinamibacterales bacterium]|nr:ribosome maturation factor RimM [Vicinamibacterales bacterium]